MVTAKYDRLSQTLPEERPVSDYSLNQVNGWAEVASGPSTLSRSCAIPMANIGRRRTQMGIAQYDPAALCRPAWNAGQKVDVKKPLKQRQIWEIRCFLDREGRMRDWALFNLAIDSKLRGCDLVKIKIGTLVSGQEIRKRAMVIQQKTGRPVKFEITSDVRASLLAWLERRGGTIDDFVFPAGLITPIILARANMPGWSMNW